MTAAPADGLRRRELAEFLRSRRERIVPEQVGLPPGGRRRTPGLRREEVASLAGVGVTWYTWLEQARDINVSDQVLEAIARTLLLDPHERTHLYRLAGSALTGVVEAQEQAVSPVLRQIVDQLEPYPASVSNGRYDLLAYNRSYMVIGGDLDTLPYEDRNSMWLCFTHPSRQSLYLDNSEVRRRMVAQFRGSMAEHVAEPAYKCLLNRLLKASPEFGELWKRHDVLEPEDTVKRFHHHELGLLTFTYTSLWLSPRMDVRLVVHVPNDEHTRAAMERDDVKPYPMV